MAGNGGKKGGTFEGTTVYLSRNLVAPEIYNALFDALRLNGADVRPCCDPSKNSPLEFHVISSSDHEKFADLRAKGCNLLGPQCVLSCAKEHRVLPKQGYTCCLAMDGVKVLTSGFEKNEKARIQERVCAMGGLLLDKPSLDIDFVIAKNVLATKYKWALNVLKKPIISITWLDHCWMQHRIVPHEPYRLLPFTGLTICVTKIPLDERRQIGKMIEENGGQYSADLTKKCTHLVSDGVGGDKYTVAKRWGNIHIINRRWIDMSIAKRACLDEAVYPVTKNQPSRTSSASSSQKEKQCQHQEQNMNTIPQFVKTVATPAKPAEPCLSQNVSSSLPDMVLNELYNEKKVTTDIAGHDVRVAEDSEDGDDLYLSGCRISLVGFTEKEMARIVSLVRRGGGTRFVMLSERLTHIIVGAPSEIEKKEVRRLASFGTINIIRAAWLEECHRTKREVDISSFLASDLIVAKDPTNGISTGSEASTGQTNSSEMESLIARKRTRQSVLDFGSKPEKSIRDLCAESCSSKEGSNSKLSTIFHGKRFCFSASFPYDRRGEVIEWVEEGGGIVIEDPKRTAVHFLIECHGLNACTTSTSSPPCTVVTTQWIRSCLEGGSLLDVGSHILFSPLKCRVPLPGFEKLKFCFSLYEEREKFLLKNLCFTLGAKYSDRITKKMTHLVCKFASGPKYEFSIKRNIQTVTAEWIYECVAKDSIAPLDDFRPRAITSQEREEGLCPVTQFPSEDAKMVASQTQLTSSKDKDGYFHEGVCEEMESLSTSKRVKLSGQNIARHEVKVRQKLPGSAGAVSDVAEAIEDLLAQSTMIQDMNPQEQLGCERNIFTADSLVLDQDGENAHSISISRHWLNKAQKQDNTPDAVKCVGRNPAYDAFSESQSESQIVGYEEDLSGRQKIIDRLRSQSLTPSAV
ncbi:DNA topoisomerase 2-binding protein 1 [Rhynchospora pubera]|uniref:DNA topoisomerase 2-binding protein 1 n=1 Tax=Rhynchospora pubera TaxID=906938 RepID=A0AAV8FNY2_9POAL|nr:DNA topoisomerase 2-binding protein 1 [Rhynchospora pubera]